MASKIQFVISTGSTSKETKRAQRKIVRSHVTTQRYQKQREEDVKAFKLSNPNHLSIPSDVVVPGSSEVSLRAAHRAEDAEENTFSISNSETCPRALVVGTSAHLTQYSSGILSFSKVYEIGPEQHEGLWLPFPYSFPTLGSPYDDPFVSIPAALPPRVSKHLFYFVNVLMPQMHPSYMANSVRKKFRCSSLADVDELSLSGMSAYSATSRAMLSSDLMKGRGVNGIHAAAFDRIYFKGKTIKLVTDRLTQVDKAVADTTIGGVCDLIFLETLTGNVIEARTHMAGLRRLAALRQKHSHPMPFSLASKIIACAVKLATLTHSKPLVPFILNSNISLPLPAISHLLPKLGTKIISDWPQISQTVDQDFIYILHDMASMTRHTEAIFDWIFPKREDDLYYEYINAQNLSVEHRLLSYTPSNFREECVRLTCILYVNTCLVRGFPISAAIIQNVVTVLRDILKKSLETNDWRSHEDVLFWVLFVGAYCTERDAEDTALVKTFREVVAHLNLYSWEDAKALLSTLFYVDRVYGDRGKEIWEIK